MLAAGAVLLLVPCLLQVPCLLDGRCLLAGRATFGTPAGWATCVLARVCRHACWSGLLHVLAYQKGCAWQCAKHVGWAVPGAGPIKVYG